MVYRLHDNNIINFTKSASNIQDIMGRENTSPVAGPGGFVGFGSGEPPFLATAKKVSAYCSPVLSKY